MDLKSLLTHMTGFGGADGFVRTFLCAKDDDLAGIYAVGICFLSRYWDGHRDEFYNYALAQVIGSDYRIPHLFMDLPRYKREEEINAVSSVLQIIRDEHPKLKIRGLRALRHWTPDSFSKTRVTVFLSRKALLGTGGATPKEALSRLLAPFSGALCVESGFIPGWAHEFFATKNWEDMSSYEIFAVSEEDAEKIWEVLKPYQWWWDDDLPGWWENDRPGYVVHWRWGGGLAPSVSSGSLAQNGEWRVVHDGVDISNKVPAGARWGSMTGTRSKFNPDGLDYPAWRDKMKSLLIDMAPEKDWPLLFCAFQTAERMAYEFNEWVPAASLLDGSSIMVEMINRRRQEYDQSLLAERK